MAIIKTFNMCCGTTAEYWEVKARKVDYQNEKTYITLGLWVDAAKRAALGYDGEITPYRKNYDMEGIFETLAEVEAELIANENYPETYGGIIYEVE